MYIDGGGVTAGGRREGLVDSVILGLDSADRD